jgi:hypothetical protein
LEARPWLRPYIPTGQTFGQKLSQSTKSAVHSIAVSKGIFAVLPFENVTVIPSSSGPDNKKTKYYSLINY